MFTEKVQGENMGRINLREISVDGSVDFYTIHLSISSRLLFVYFHDIILWFVHYNFVHLSELTHLRFWS
jgi:hypothetical protein